MSYLDENSFIKNFIELLTNANLVVWSKQNMKYKEKIGDFLDMIKQSVIVVFMITKKYLKNKQLVEEIKYAKQFKKIIFPIIIDDSIEEDFKSSVSECVDLEGFNEIIDVKSGYFIRVYVYILRVFGKENRNIILNKNEQLCIKTLDWSDNQESFKEFPIKSFEFISGMNFKDHNDIESIVVNKVKNEHIIVTKRNLHDLNIENLETNKIGKHSNDPAWNYLGDFYSLLSNTNFQFTNSFCYLEHLKKYCGIIIIKNKYNLALFNELSYELVKSEILPEIFQNSRLLMLYSEINKKTYVFINEKKVVEVFDENLKSEKQVSLKYRYMVFNIYIHSDRFYTPDASLYVIHVYDLDFNYLTSFGYSVLDKNIGLSIHFDSMNNTNYLFAKSRTTLYAFNLRSYKFVGKMNVELMDSYSCFTNKKFIEVPQHELFLKLFNIKYKIFKNKFVKYGGNLHIIDAKYICKLNPLNQHLYRDAYLLPCGNLACLACIYDNFNIFTKRLTCNSDNCKLEHRLKINNITQFNGIIDENLYEISEQLNGYGKSILADLGEYLI